MLVTAMDRQGKGARRLDASFFRTDGAVRTISVDTGRPVTKPEVIDRLFRERLDALNDPLDPGFGFDLIRLSASRTEIVVQQQRDLDANVHDNDELAALIDRIAARIGGKRVVVHLPQDTHIPERAVMAVASTASSGGRRAGGLAGAYRKRAAAAAVAAVRQAGADQSAVCNRARRPAASVHLAPRHPRGGAGGGARTHRHGMVEAERRWPDAGLFPHRGRSGTCASGSFATGSMKANRPMKKASPHPVRWFVHGLFA